MRRVMVIAVLAAVALLSVAAPVLAGPFEFPFLQPPSVGAPVSHVGFNLLPAPAAATVPTPAVLDDRGVR